VTSRNFIAKSEEKFSEHNAIKLLHYWNRQKTEMIIFTMLMSMFCLLKVKIYLTLHGLCQYQSY